MRPCVEMKFPFYRAEMGGIIGRWVLALSERVMALCYLLKSQGFPFLLCWNLPMFSFLR